MSCEQLGLPAPTLPPDESKTDDLGLKDSEELISKLNPEQRVAFNRIVDSLDSGRLNRRAWLLLGPGGCGKTFLYPALIAYFRTRKLKVLCVAWTGIAAIL